MKQIQITIIVDVPDDTELPANVLTYDEIILLLQNAAVREAIEEKRKGRHTNGSDNASSAQH